MDETRTHDRLSAVVTLSLPGGVKTITKHSGRSALENWILHMAETPVFVLGELSDGTFAAGNPVKMEEIWKAMKD